MNIYDDVKVKVNKKQYSNAGVFKGMIGKIILDEIRENRFYVNFIDKNFEIDKNDPKWFEKHFFELADDISIPIKMEDLELAVPNRASDEEILDSLPLQSPKWWCKVENGYILNLLGEKKNKIPYDYNS